ncbi:F-box protein [Melia azedarach]|uniref:F-box protein n=1 Tax=Melia azedarach TaxID=155640 RepID=A0ACC1WZW6_MELAZ|nr:F-box protein [Melia azedarach]
MASLRASNLLFTSSFSSSNRINAAISVPKLPKIRFSPLKTQNRSLVEELKIRDGFTNSVLEKIVPSTSIIEENNVKDSTSMAATQLYAILEAVADRVEMHKNVGEQRDNWNALLLNSINMITLTAATYGCIPSEDNVKEAMEKVLALDKAYPLPLIGKMIEKFPKTFEPAVWWPSNQSQRNNTKQKIIRSKTEENGWTEALETEMREIVSVLKRKDTEDYVRLGNLGLKINKVLAISAPILTGIAALGSTFVGHGIMGCGGCSGRRRFSKHS